MKAFHRAHFIASECNERGAQKLSPSQVLKVRGGPVFLTIF
jgi:hypothetical protein